MADITIWLAMAGMTVIIVFSRSLFLLAGTRVNIPARVQKALRFAPAAALVALISPELFAVGNAVSIDSLNPALNPKLWVGFVAGLLFFYKRNMLLMIAVGMLLFTLLRIYPL